MERRLFYDLEIRARRVEANVDYTDMVPIDEKPTKGMRLVVDSTLSNHTGVGDILLRQVLEGLAKAYANEEGYEPHELAVLVDDDEVLTITRNEE